jgi:16S rRNA (cytidine1402-2'-O)-methyltransferase
MAGTLYIVAVPIGNLEDITIRAKRILGEVDQIACEDTRRTGKLLELLALNRPPLISLFDHNEAKRTPKILETLQEGADVALVSDAGTPTISDPGFRLVRAVIDAGLSVVPIPGACAVTTALCAAGLPTNQFRFMGFAPPKGSALNRFLAGAATVRETLIFYVGPHHLARFLASAVEQFGGHRSAVICRELTKRYEEFRRGTLAELSSEPGTIRGEIVLIISGATEDESRGEVDVDEVIRVVIAEGKSTAKTAKELVKRTGMSRDEAYSLIVEIRQNTEPS